MIHSYVNIASGLEWLERPCFAEPPHFIRIPSTWCEQGEWDRVFMSIDADLLMHLALGHRCVVYDCGSRKGWYSRAQWQALPILRYVCEKEWHLSPTPVRFEPYADKSTFHEADATVNTIYCDTLTRSTKNRIKYFRHFLDTDRIDLGWEGMESTLDGQYDKLRELVLP